MHQCPLEKTDDSDARVWVTFRYDPSKGDDLTTKYFDDWTITWGDWLKGRQEGQSPNNDPNFSKDKVPDIIFWSPGYHSSTSSSHRFGMLVDNMLSRLEEKTREINPPVMPQMHLMLNIMPAPWKIPNHYQFDKEYRTLLNEHRKNLAIIEAAKLHVGGGFVRGILDVFSCELLFNGHKGEDTVHHDAVHLGGNAQVVFRAAGNRIIDTMCYS